MVYESIADDRVSEYRTKATHFWREYQWKGRVRLPKAKSDASLLVYSEVSTGLFYQLKILVRRFQSEVAELSGRVRVRRGLKTKPES